ncbi:Holliday junction DNA helicase RuvA [candidate division Kazan bacterium RIFCSPHIGHO2_01_FULL_49_10]|uniref:Holliday junction branch migration complex subunit RuvA n=1 Tax=candidate division Kazan bacterium RIFCSPLOWO2_01_FULL_48_13 TaxID=1798539 RepID=A0A1F4PN71_UNCK3|nr:MAG: Holliday junction DNA helicase RuvA [candidate division Kazan bacterium RIFCSPHIGHO2_01_FULL_49_10]OGB85079.1 MAG: Holliday junction DNA helicase RuvA [candidate division Kazan bacterium RIFCSPLOWO2_01_FULL_48_13]
MIASVSGRVVSKGLDHLVVEAGGIGYLVFTTTDILTTTVINDEIRLLTHMVVREDVQALYGFISPAQLQLFSMLISVSGVGPRIGLAVLSSGKVEELRSAIGRGDSAIFTAISGIGKKTAERIILELKSRITDIVDVGVGGSSADIINALSGLGYNMYEIREVLGKLSPDAKVEDKLKEALKLLS